MQIHPDAPPVVLYSKPTGCGQCIATKSQLDKLGVPYVNRDVTTDPNAAQRVRTLGYQGVPVLEVGDMHWKGFRHDNIKRLADILEAWQPHDGEALAVQFLAEGRVA